MADENKIQNPSADPAKIKQLEIDLKNAYKEERFEDVKKLAADLKTLEPTSHLAERLLEKTQKAETDALKKANKEKIKVWEVQIRQAFKVGNLPAIEQIAAEVKKVDPENKVVRKIEGQIDEARAMLVREENKGKIKALEIEIKMLMKMDKWNDVRARANELLGLDKGSRFALKAIKKADKTQPQAVSAGGGVTSAPVKEPEKPAPAVSPAPVVLVKPEAPKPEIKTETKPVETKIQEVSSPVSMKTEEKKEGHEIKKTEKSGFFARLFSKKAEAEKAPLGSDKKVQETPQKKEAVKKEVKKEPVKPDPEKIKKEKISSLESEMKQALKDKNESEVKRLMEEIRALEPKSKTIVKAQAQLDKEKARLEASAKKEKVNGLTKELKSALKNEEWKKAEEKADELLKTDTKNKTALKALEKAKAAQKAPEAKKEIAKKPGFFARLFAKKQKAPEKTPEIKKEAEKKPVVKKMEAKPVAEPVKPMPAKAGPSVVPVVNPPVAPVVPPSPSQKPVTPAAFTPPPKPIVAVPRKEVVKAVEKTEMPKPAAVPVPLGMAQKSVFPEPAAESAGKTEGEKGNIFTKLFGEKKAVSQKEASGKSIIDTIVSKTEEGKKAEQKAKKKPDLYADHFVRFTTVFLEFSVAFILISAGFFYAQNIDTENRVLSLIGIEENNASRLYAAAQELEGLDKDEKKVSKEIKEYQEGYTDKNKEVVQNIVENRLDWPDLIKKLNEVTESVYEKNPLSQYVQYNNYAYDVERGELRVSATLSDPLGKNLTKLAELEEAFRYFPKDKNDPNDEREPYFYGLKDFTSFSKTYSKTTGRYISNFSLTLYTKPLEDGKKKK